MLNLKLEWKSVVLSLQETWDVFQPPAASGVLSGYWNYHPDSLFSCKLWALTPVLYKTICLLPVSPLFFSAACPSTVLPVYFSTCLSLWRLVRPFPFRLTLHFTHVSLFVCSCLSSVPVRWNIGALLMIQQSFSLLIHPSVPYVRQRTWVKLGFPSSRKQKESCAAWMALILTCYIHYR